VELSKCAALLLTGFSLAAHGAEQTARKAASNKAVQPDIEFLEYLGTAEGDDENWTEIDGQSVDWQPSESTTPTSESKDSAKTEAPAKRVTDRK
jgi:hypothetical protein